ncbi:DMT family transporter [Sulfidibacter corallicola]|uniref:DMT family transporter n=1 Tax=Sulfidibacter corallicola TaxID=2818388 RepID=A0A8A4TLI9_SULCO|nr:DMT family transporter [Sulfidibacter corallicola]QTD49738.1 DMT family transporter [Sulfidibacter corallicola]
MDQSDHQPRVAAGVAFGLTTAAIWGAWPVLSGFSIARVLNAYDIAALRFGISGLLLVPYLWRHKSPGVAPIHLAAMVCGAGAPYVLACVWGLGLAPAGHFGVITPSCMLTFSSLAAWLLMGDRPTRVRILGWLAILLGVVMVGLRGLTSGEPSMWLGDLIFMVCGMCWATYTVTFKACGLKPLHATALVSVISMVIYLPFYFGLGLGNLGRAPIEEVMAQGVFQGVLSAIVALVCYNKAVSILGVSRGSVFGALVPAIALLLAIPVLGEIPNVIEVSGLVLVSVGMVLVLGLVPRFLTARRSPAG